MKNFIRITFVMLFVLNLYPEKLQAYEHFANVNCNTRLNIRTGPGTQYRRLGSIPCELARSEDLEVFKLEGEWAELNYRDIRGYSHIDYLDMVIVLDYYLSHGFEIRVEAGNYTTEELPEIIKNRLNELSENQEDPPRQESFFGSFGAEKISTILSSTRERTVESEGYVSYQVLRDGVESLGGNPMAVDQIECFMNYYGDRTFDAVGDSRVRGGVRIENQDFIVLVDLTLNSRNNRLFLLNRITGEVKSYQVAHGAGVRGSSSRNEDGDVRYVSNRDGSRLSPSGFHITANSYEREGLSRRQLEDPDVWKIGVKMHGIQDGINHNSHDRGIVFHWAWYLDEREDIGSSLDPEVISYRGRAGRSHGCFAVNRNHRDELYSILDSGSYQDGGILFYVFSENEEREGYRYCGFEDGLLLAD